MSGSGFGATAAVVVAGVLLFLLLFGKEDRLPLRYYYCPTKKRHSCPMSHYTNGNDNWINQKNNNNNSDRDKFPPPPPPPPNLWVAWNSHVLSKREMRKMTRKVITRR